ncbi:MAG TPA: alpha/beta fold hydrolase [Thermoanaerobaculia bacterium]|nr:alpha/beta fold hydrolase [Thermoanaerobaculia bacterium]
MSTSAVRSRLGSSSGAQGPEHRRGRGRRRRSRRRIAAWWIVLYLVLLAASHAIASRRQPTRGPDDRAAISVRVVRGEQQLASSARLAYREWPTAMADSAADALRPVLLLHGSPGSADDFRTLGPALARDRRVIAPDLPGFGASERAVPDYSVLAHAGYALQLLEKLDIERCHVLGFSMGGGVALELWGLAPERVASLTMLSAIGVEELELFGDQQVNHWVHGLQLGLVRALLAGSPHFGALDDFPLGREYARNFYDTDQSRLRALLERFEPPLLLVHGERDFLVPQEAALEHHRIVPQSELALLQDDHFMVFRDGAELATRELAPFLARVEEGQAVRRASAAPERVAGARRPFDRAVLPPFEGPALLVTLVGLVLAMWVSEDLTCLAAGLLVALGRISFLAACGACFVGIVGTDFMLYLFGRWVGRPALAYAPLRWWLPPQRLDEASAWVRERGAAVIFASRFLPGTRLATSVACGALQTSASRFVLYFAIAASVWVPLVVWLAARLGAAALPLMERTQGWLLALLLGMGLLLVTLRLLVPALWSLRTWTGRRKLLGRWRRIGGWELWPMWAVYPPVVLYVLWLGLRHRSLTLFAAANPGIPDGGFVGESKAEILSKLPTEVVPVWRLVTVANGAELRREVERFLSGEGAASGFGLPVVIKPDVGQRGQGVMITRRLEDAERYFERWPQALPAKLILQRYAPGLEIGIFWAKGTAEDHGEILSLTEKRPPTVTGDGEHTLEHLVLADDRAVALHRVYLRERPDAARFVPAAGENVPLVDVGTHARGCIFLDGSEHLTTELEAAMDRLADAYPGFDFGRLDVKVDSLEALRRGGPFQVVELNGVTSECVHVYDPRVSFVEAYRVLFRQWRRAFEIGAQRRAMGQAPPGVRRLVALVIAHRRRGLLRPDQR